MLDRRKYRNKKEFYEVDINIIKKLIKGCEDLTLVSDRPEDIERQSGGWFVQFFKEGS
jgi:hypothetical protein